MQELKTVKQTFANFGKADWSGFQNEAEALKAGEECPTDVYKVDQSLLRQILRASNHSISMGNRRPYIPFLTDPKNFLKSRDELSHSNTPHESISKHNSLIPKEMSAV